MKLLLVCVCFVMAAQTQRSSATDIYREPWHWGNEIPAAVLSPVLPPTVRNPRAFDHAHIGLHTTLKNFVAKFGVPDAFARQFLVTRTEGIPVQNLNSGPNAGTFRYALRGGGEVLISVSDFDTITAMWRFEKSGVRHDLYRRDNG